MKSKEKRIIYILLIGFTISFLNVNIIDLQKQILRYDKNTEDTILFNLKSSGYWVLIDTTIVIDNSAPYWEDSINWTTATEQPWCTGAGTMGDPYIIENLTMIGYDYQASIWIMDSNVHFIIRNCTFIGEGTGLDIWSSINGSLVNNTFSEKWTGVSFSYCQDFTIFENKFNDNMYGMEISQGDQYNVSKNSFNNDNSGIFMMNDVMNSLIYANTFEDNEHGIHFAYMFGENNNFSANIMNGCGFFHYAGIAWAETTIIESSNLVNGKPLYFYYNESNLRSVNFTNAGQVILIKCNNSNISNLNLSRSTYGIGLYYCKNNTLTNLNCSFNNIAGFLLNNCYNITLDKNLAIYNHYDSNLATYMHYYGISLSYGNGYNLTNNQMFDCGLNVEGDLEDFYLNSIDTTNEVNNKPIYYIVNETGLDDSNYPNAGQLFLIDCNNSLITDLELYNTSQGIVSYYCYNNSYNNISSAFNYRGMIFSSCSNNIISGNNVTHNYGDGIYLSNCNNNTVLGNTIREASYTGLQIGGDGNRIIENTIADNQYNGVSIYGEYNNITNNNIFNNGDGIRIGHNYNTVSRNNITGNVNYGIYLRQQYNMILYNNISYNQNHGIFLEYGSNNIVSGNLINQNNGTGIFLMGSSSNDIIGNGIKFNDECGLILYQNTNWNTIYNNNFTGNFLNAEDNGTINVWDNGVIGNYWDDYIGADDNDDGIGDIPYTNIGGTAGAQDKYPIWWDPLVFFIISPIDDQFCGGDAPIFIIEIEKGIPDFMWYTLNDLPTKHFFPTNTTINQGAWEAISGSTITIAFYINDSAGKIVYDNVIVKKDTIVPIIIINSPLQNSEFEENPSTFVLVIIEDFIDDIWYTLNDGITNHSCGLSGQINQTFWDILPEGTYNLRFYASDTVGNVGHSDVIIIKTAPSIVVPGFDILIMFLTIIVSMVSISWQIRKER